MASSITPGTYRHYKGNDYRVIGTATHSETLETLVVYQPLYGERNLWVRPQKMFCEEVLVDGKHEPRFQLIQADASDSPLESKASTND